MTTTRSRLLSVALLVPAAALLAPVAGAAPGFPGVDQVVTSANVRHVTNVPPTAPLNGPGHTGTDLAFTGNYAIAGDYDGFTIYDIADKDRPVVASQVLCPGSQNDVSVSGNLLFLSTDSRRTDDSCTSASSGSGTQYWEGIKIFDISDKGNPRYLKSVETACGSHTHTLVPDKTGTAVYLYVSSYSPSTSLSKCQPPHDKISIVKVPLASPTTAAVVATPVLFPGGGNPGSSKVSATSGCHDITAYPSKDLAAGACMGDGVLLDIADRERPRVIHQVQDNVNFAFWHSATFNNAGTKVIFTDELGGGGAATCNKKTGPTRGADGIYDITGTGDARRLVFRSYFKISRYQTTSENCVAHNGSLIPVAGRDIMVQAWYQGGAQIWDFTDSANPVEIGFFERGPLPNNGSGGSWSAYWYNGRIYSSDLVKGLDVIDVNDPRTDPAKSVTFTELNVQTQGTF
ncbi:LVIVD repeat-containing protein [Actinokineospora sp. HUAS TT18]|uniref:LVIVD repeat-containing protein n=1 Tax=Actinokineospora sp. HUAS TT18 TaxID=3447451 RepID=UPI003F52106D